MQKTLILFLATLLCFSCTDKKAEDAPKSVLQPEAKKALAPTIQRSLASELDTIIVKEDTLHLTQIGKADFQKYQRVDFDTSEYRNIILDSARVKRVGRKLILKVSSPKKQVVLENTSPQQEMEAEADLVRFSYLGNLKEISQWLIGYDLYEGFGYLLIDQMTGEQHPVHGVPSISPDKKNFICGSGDLIAGYNPNGLQLFKVTKGSIELVWERELTKWGPGELVWESNNSVLAEQFVLDSAYNEKTRYVRLSIKRD